MYTWVASLCLPRSCLLRAAFPPCKSSGWAGGRGGTRAQFNNTGLFKKKKNQRNSLSGCLTLCSGWWKLLRQWDYCGRSVSHGCNTPHLNTDIDMACMFFLSFYFVKSPPLLPVCFTYHAPVSLWERKLMRTRHALGRLVLEIAPQ